VSPTIVKSKTYPDALRFGDWRVERATGELTGPQGTQRLEPKVADLLFLLAARAGQAVTREQIMAALWPGQVVGEDSLARAVFKLRQALGDEAKSPRFIETLSKRGYRWLAAPEPSTDDAGLAVSPGSPASNTPARRPPRRWPRLVSFAALLGVVLAGTWWFAGARHAPQDRPPGVASLTAQADDFYFQFSRADNEAAIELYERVLGLAPDDAPAMAGLANALVQRSVRWPQLPGEPPAQFTRLGDALAHGHLRRAPAVQQLERAQRLAERAVALAPRSAAAHKALGFVASAQGRFDVALDAYAQAVVIDPENWGALINIGDVLEISGRPREALPYFERAYAAMERGYARNPVQIRPWHAQLGALIAGRHADAGDASTAESWYRRVLSRSPLHAEATRGLARLLRAGGDDAEAARLCAELESRVGKEAACGPASTSGQSD
jgi:transcriptional activator of cad operon